MSTVAVAFKSGLKAVGMDCEWDYSTVPGSGGKSSAVALLQLAFPNGKLLILRDFMLTNRGNTSISFKSYACISRDIEGRAW
jgi:hypothetical protein